MKRFAVTVGLLAAGALLGRGWDRMVCVLHGHAEPERVYVGGDHRGGLGAHRCRRCRTAVEPDYVRPDRRIGSRRSA